MCERILDEVSDMGSMVIRRLSRMNTAFFRHVGFHEIRQNMASAMNFFDDANAYRMCGSLYPETNHQGW
jgi:hypothetical protein